MSRENLEKFKLKCKAYLTTIDIHRLRAYGRSIGVARPAAKDKEELIEDIVAILSFELAPIERSKRGAPVKNDVVDSRIPDKIAEIKAECFANDIMMDVPEYNFQKEYEQMLKDTENARTLTLNDPAVERDGAISKVVSRGQVSYLEEEWVLLPEDGSFPDKKVPIPVSLIERHKLREGDVIACYFREKEDWQRVEVIISINGVGAEMLKDRPNFEECNVCYAQKRINVFEGSKNASLSHKCVEWLFPITCGQRACVVSSPKAGKTRILRELAQAVKRLNPHAEVLVLLCDQTPETVAEFTRIYGNRGLVYTTYEDDADRQVYVAEWVLKRAKRYAEMGRTVVLFVDSLTALARAFNDTEASMGGKTLPCGLEVKTVHYLKKYFGTARCLEKGGSITIFGALNIGSGNPMDDIIARELSELATLKLELSDELSIRRIYPAIDFEKSSGNYDASVEGVEAETEILLRNKLLPRIGSQGVLKLLEESNSKEEFIEKIKKIANG